MSIYRYWGKAHRKNSTYHLLPYHCLDVAASCYILLKKDDWLRKTLANLLNLPEDVVVKLVVFFVSVHDIGKFSESFQQLRSDILFLLRQVVPQRRYSIHHTNLGFLLWEMYLWDKVWNLNLLSLDKSKGNRNQTYWKRAIRYFGNATFGHHGKPPTEEGLLQDHFESDDIKAALEFVIEMSHLFLNDLPPYSLSHPLDFIKLIRKASWLIAGLIIYSDWIGSDFPYESRKIPLKDYWNTALNLAETSVQESGIVPVPISQQIDMSSLFPLYSPTPLQKAISSIPLSDSPQLFFLEDITGSGKTEGGLVLGHRLLAEGFGDGIYFALPTMATSNSMHERMTKIYQKLFCNNSSPSLVLAHSSRDSVKTFRNTIIKNTSQSDVIIPGEESTQAVCSEWLGDHKKASLSAPFGVGTVDQALMSVLPYKHQSMRLLGLLRKILLVDEAHSYDAYTTSLLESLLEFHARFGGSAIICSATLSNDTKHRLASAFYKGLEPQKNLPRNNSPEFPLITRVDKTGIQTFPIESSTRSKKKFKVNLINNVERVIDFIKESSDQGQCICWIRNTIADARTGYELLKGIIPKDKLTLFHSEFALCDRLAIEEKVTKLFGPKSTKEDRQGQVLVSTQVVEQSLDVDFDKMVTDLCYIDLVLQRNGRRLRHTRNKDGVVIDGPDEREDSGLHILSPNPIDDPPAEWYSDMFEKASFVYDNHAQLWLAARLLDQDREWQLPEDCRELLESVYGPDIEIPKNLIGSASKSETKEERNRSKAQYSILRVEQGYQTTDTSWEDEDTDVVTRLGNPTVTLILSKWDGTNLTPWAPGTPDDWAGSQVTVRKKKIAQADIGNDKSLETKIEEVKSWRGNKWKVVLPLRETKEGWVSYAFNLDGKSVKVLYSPEKGLEYTVEK
jgi:CRISPR-associated endonuclease/helicase Cas3